MITNDAETLRRSGIQPSAQRVAIAQYVLHTGQHPSADEVWARVREHFPMVSRATVYNTLNLFVRKGLLREFVLVADRVVFDPNVGRHHHFIDQRSGGIHDVPWEALAVSNVEKLKQYRVEEYQVVLRGRLKRKREGS